MTEYTKKTGLVLTTLGILIMVAAILLAIYGPDTNWVEKIGLGLLFIVGLGATIGGSEEL